MTASYEKLKLLALKTQEGTIKTYIGWFLKPDIASVFSSDEPNTFSFSQLDQGGILTLGMPQTLATERRYMQTYLKILFFYHALSRFDKPKADRINENLLLLVADEYQDVVTAAEDGLSDHKFIDRIRAANTAIITGMQSDISADPAISEKKREVLTLNMRSRFIFRAAEEKGATASANFIGKHMVTKKTRTSKLFGPVTISRRKEQEFYIRPSELLRLPDHTAVIAHPSKKFVKKRIAPRNSKDETYPWY